MNVIELRDVGKTFTDRDEPTVALKNISLTIAAGEFIAIIGPSGSGKSTLMNILGLLDEPSKGAYLLDGQEVASYRDRQLAKLRRQKIGFVFQSFNLLPRLSVVQNVELPLVYGGLRGRKRRRRAMELLRLVGLDDRAGYKPSQISGGQTQRVAIARALANRPSLILADEPTGNLDTKSSSAIIGELRRLNRETSATIVIVTHNPEIANQTDRTVTVRDGEIVSDTGPRRARRRPAAAAAATANPPSTTAAGTAPSGIAGRKPAVAAVPAAGAPEPSGPTPSAAKVPGTRKPTTVKVNGLRRRPQQPGRNQPGDNSQ